MYRVTPRIGEAAQVSSVFPSAATTQVVTGLTNGVTYTFEVTAIQASGADSATSARSNPVTPAAQAVLDIEAGSSHSCAVFDGGTVRCWGRNTSGQLGNGTTVDSSSPVAVPGITGATMIAVGHSHTCALLAGGTVRCWGYNGSGQLGNGTTSRSTAPVERDRHHRSDRHQPRRTHHTCALLSGGAVRCWGFNGNGQLGNGTTADSTTPVAVTGITGATYVAAGDFHTCAQLADTTVRCWGANGSGQLGNGTTTTSSTPVAVTGLSGRCGAGRWRRPHVRRARRRGRRSAGATTTSGQLGDGTLTSRSTPVAVSGLTGASAVEAGQSPHLRALVAGGALSCWGTNGSGQLGNGSLLLLHHCRERHRPLGSDRPGRRVGARVCASLASGAVRCWGSNSSGQLGNGGDRPRARRRSRPPLRPGLWPASPRAGTTPAPSRREAQPGAGATTRYRQLGDGTTVDSSGGVQVSGVAGATGARRRRGPHLCPPQRRHRQVLGRQRVRAAGHGSLRQPAGCQDGHRSHWCNVRGRRAAVTPVPCSPAAASSAGARTTLGSSGRAAPRRSARRHRSRSRASPAPRSVAAGGSHTCALLAGGTVKCWGDNTFGQLGRHAQRPRTHPVSVTGLTDATSIATGANHSCALRTTGGVSCWGRNSHGALGNGTATGSSTPVAATGVAAPPPSPPAPTTPVRSSASGAGWCWGRNTYGQLGNNATADTTYTPVPIAGLTDATTIRGGNDHTCATTAPGLVRCWGNNEWGQVGVVTLAASSTPVQVLGT